MTTLFLACAALGGIVLISQIVLSMFGVGEGHGLEEGLELLSVRAIAAGLAFFGAGGLAGGALGSPLLVGLPVGIVAGAAAMYGTARITRAIVGLNSDRTPLVEEAIGERATVYLAIPGGADGAGKVHVTLRGRLVELTATTRGEPLPTGTLVTVVDTIGETLVVAPIPPQELTNV